MSDGRAHGVVQCIAHRGDSWNHAENTRAAFDAALTQGADAIELDVQLSRDGVPVVYHDRTLTRAGGGRRRVSALTLRELRRLDAAARVANPPPHRRIPTLLEVLQRYGTRTRLLIEIKARERETARLHQLVECLAALVRAERLTRRVSILCFEIDLLDHLAEVAPRLRRVLNVDRRRRRRLWAALPRVDTVSADVRLLDRAFARRLREAGRPLLVYTCNTPLRVRAALEAGAVGIMSDRPGWLGEQLAAAGVRR